VPYSGWESESILGICMLCWDGSLSFHM
jgi:hypothetical protein